LIVQHRRISHQKLQQAIVLGDRTRNQGVEIGDTPRQQIPAQPEIDDASRRRSGDCGGRAVRRQHGFALVDRRDAAILVHFTQPALQHDEDEVVIVDERGRMAAVHRRQ